MPSATDYAEAVQNPSVAFRDADLKAGRVATDALGLPLVHAGNFAAVFEIASQDGDQKWAAKCFTRNVPGLQDRYRQIAIHLDQHRHQLPFTVHFRYLPEGISVHGTWYPILKMDWVEGLRLDEFLADCLSQPNYSSTLRMLCDMWLRMARLLREADVGHGDLQHGNVLLVPAPEKGGYRLRLIDYDGMYVPALATYPSNECGHPAYQHPQRVSTGAHGLEIDRFSHLAIFCSLRCLIAGGPRLWKRHYDGDRLLLGSEDLEKPAASSVFHELRQLPEPAARDIAGHLILAAQGDLTDVPPLNDVAVDPDRVLMTEDQRQQLDRVLPGPAESPPRESSGVKSEALVPSPPADAESPDSLEQPLSVRGRAAAVVGSVVGAIWWLLRCADRLLVKFAGEENVILHHFLRLVLAVCLLGGTGLSVTFTVRSYRDAVRAAREAAGAAKKEAETAQRDAVKQFETDVRPACFQVAEQHFAEASAVLDRGRHKSAAKAFGRSKELFDRARIEASVANRCGQIQSTWKAVWKDTDEQWLNENAGLSLATAQEHASQAMQYQVAGNLQAATVSYEIALETLENAKGEALLQMPLTVPFPIDVAQQRQQDWFRHVGVPIDETNSIGMKLRFIPPGEFLPALPTGETHAAGSADPSPVRGLRPFYVGVSEVTQEEYERVTGRNPSSFSRGGGERSKVAHEATVRYPVDRVSWEKAIEFCRNLSLLPEEQAAQRVYRLPTEAEWEFACRAGTGTAFHFGDQLNGREANCNGRSPDGTGTAGVFLGRTTRVGAYPPNAFGLFDMHGNVAEWCGNPPGIASTQSSAEDLPEPTSPVSPRVHRGGGWNSPAALCRSASRPAHPQSHRSDDRGFRVVMVRPIPGMPAEPAEPPPEEPAEAAPEIAMPTPLRTDPALFPVSDVEVQPGVIAALASSARGDGGLGGLGRLGGGGSLLGEDDSEVPILRPEQRDYLRAGYRPRNRHQAVVGAASVVIRGLVPLEKQRMEYDRCLVISTDDKPGNLDHDSRDRPHYIYCYIERHEVGSDRNPVEFGKTEDGQPVFWRKLNIRRELERAKTWPKVAELADPRFVDELLTMPPAPVVGRDLIDILMHPDVPLAPGKTNGAGLDEEVVGSAASASGYDDGDTSRQDQILFRAYDFDVDPTKRYRYRVKLLLDDPNNPQDQSTAPRPETLRSDVVQRLADQRAANAANARRTYWRETPWSDESDIVNFPPRRRVLAGDVRAERSIAVPGQRGKILLKEALATVMTLIWDPHEAVWVPGVVDGRACGSVLDYSKHAWVADPVSLDLRRLAEYPFETGQTLVDIFGGEPLPANDRKSKLTAPGEILVMDEDGSLQVRAELSDADDYQRYLYRSDTQTRESPRRATPDDDRDRPLFLE